MSVPQGAVTTTIDEAAAHPGTPQLVEHQAPSPDGVRTSGRAPDQAATGRRAYQPTNAPLPREDDSDTDDDLGERWGVIVECKTEQQQTRLLESLGAEGCDVCAIVS